MGGIEPSQALEYLKQNTSMAYSAKNCSGIFIMNRMKFLLRWKPLKRSLIKAIWWATMPRNCSRTGVEVDHTGSFEEGLKSTKELISRRVPIFEAALTYKQCYARADILEPVGEDE